MRNADSYPIQKFRLNCQISEETISTWCDAVIGPSLQEHYLHLNNIDEEGGAIILPEGIFTCPSLKSLEYLNYEGLLRFKVPSPEEWMGVSGRPPEKRLRRPTSVEYLKLRRENVNLAYY
ncbi:hypothetical protein PIB30_033726 [Stylosanthes scabra]|uniref:Uncharacterized protein n=1 Tax=Stylosanthes scabra TaxID=79078 RepID=A0ABU6ZCL8_9FABA|nr:hypothetical protein [Stylosanthes scabra]